MSENKSGIFIVNGQSLAFTFALVSSLFFVWAVCNGMIDAMDKHFQEELSLSKSQSAWVQFAHYLGYFLMSMPAGWLATKLGYKRGIILGLLIVAVGGFWFIPATHISAAASLGSVSRTTAFIGFLAGVCVIATGLTFLETIANPYTTVLGDKRFAATRINLAQSCNGLGWIFGPPLGAIFFYGKDALGHSTGSQTLYIPYVGVAIAALFLASVFAFAKMPDIKAKDDYHLDDAAPGATHSIWSHPHFVLGVAAQFFYVAAQAGIFSFFINYMTAETPSIPASWGAPGFLNGWLHGWFETGRTGPWCFSDKGAAYLMSVPYVCFFIGRFTGAGLLRRFSAHRMLGLYALMNVAMTPAGLLQTGMAQRGVRFPELLLHVDHVPHHLRAGDLRPGRAGEEGVGVHRDGDHGRRDSAEAHGRRSRQVGHVPRLHRAHVLFRVRGLLRLQLVQVQQGGLAAGNQAAGGALTAIGGDHAA